MRHLLFGLVAYGLLLNDFVINRNITKHSPSVLDNNDQNVESSYNANSTRKHTDDNVSDVQTLAHIEDDLTNELLERSKQDKLESKALGENKLAEKSYGHSIKRAGKALTNEVTKSFENEHRARNLLKDEKDHLAADELRYKKGNKLFEKHSNGPGLAEHSETKHQIDSLLQRADSEVGGAAEYLQYVEGKQNIKNRNRYMDLEENERQKALLKKLNEADCDPCNTVESNCEDDLANADDRLISTIINNTPGVTSGGAQSILDQVHGMTEING